MNNMYKEDLWIRNEIRNYKELHYRLTRRLNRISVSPVDERLTYCIKKGRKYYSEVWTENGEKKVRYLGPGDNSEVLEIQEKHFLRKALSILDNRIAQLEKSEGLVRALDFEEINASLPKAYQIPAPHLKMIMGPDEEEKWYSDFIKDKKRIDAIYKPKYAERKVHIAKDGTLMRSKSEVSIANEFINRGIPYIYEMPLEVCNITIRPDFMFYSVSRHKPMIWEHAGMLGDAEYMDDFSRRMDLYIRGGLTPCVDLLFTFDSIDGDIDTRMIDAVIDEYR